MKKNLQIVVNLYFDGYSFNSTLYENEEKIFFFFKLDFKLNTNCASKTS